MKKAHVTGTVAANPHEGGRSEVLADYLFSGWGTVTPVRRQDDYGVDLYCTLTERVGKRALVRDYFVVQVKSNMEPWVFDGEHAVRWLVEYPSPLFLACVDKSAGILRVYHVMPRFLASVLGMGTRLELIPEDTDNGGMVAWRDGRSFSLSAPLLRVTLTDLLNKEVLGTLRNVFAAWVRFDRDNCDLQRMGLLRFRMPHPYSVNQMPSSVGELGNAIPTREDLKRGIITAAEAMECIGGQLGRLGDLRGALWSALAVDHLQRKHPQAFRHEPRWGLRVPGDLGNVVCGGLNTALQSGRVPPYRYEGLEAVQNLVERAPLVRKYLGQRAATRKTKRKLEPKK